MLHKNVLFCVCPVWMTSGLLVLMNCFLLLLFDTMSLDKRFKLINSIWLWKLRVCSLSRCEMQNTMKASAINTLPPLEDDWILQQLPTKSSDQLNAPCSCDNSSARDRWFAGSSVALGCVRVQLPCVSWCSLRCFVLKIKKRKINGGV